MDWHLLWVIPTAGLVGIAGIWGYSALWFLRMEDWRDFDVLHKIREEQMRFLFWLATAILLATVWFNEVMQKLFLAGLYYWLPMLSVYMVGLITLRSRMWHRPFLAILLGTLAAVSTLKLEVWFLDQRPGLEWFYGVPIGLCAGCANELKNWYAVRRYKQRNPLERDFIPYEHVTYVFGGWLGLMYIHTQVYSGRFDYKMVMLLAAQMLFAVAVARLAAFTNSWLWSRKEGK